MKRIKIGIIGAGRIARQHLETIRNFQEAEVAAITSRTMAKAENLAREFNIPVCVDSLDVLIQKANPDALMVLVSADQMFEVALAAMKYHIPLFLEKPAGLSAEENRNLAVLAQKNSVLNMVGFNRRYYSIFHKGMEIINKHGPLLGVAVEGHERIWRIHEGGNTPKKIIDKWIFANSVHTIDLLRFFGGEPSRIKSIAHRYKEHNGDQFSAVMELECGAIGRYSAHWYSPGGWSVTLYGDGVTVEFKPLEKGYWTDKNFKIHEINPDETDLKFKTGFYNQMKSFLNLIRGAGKKWPLTDLADSYKTMQLARAISSKITINSNLRGKNGIKKS